MKVRKAAVAGTFYPSNKKSLLDLIENCFTDDMGPLQLPKRDKRKSDSQPFYVVPHAGYIYSGPIASWSYYDLSEYKAPNTVIILGPNHRGSGPDIALPNSVDAWETPLGTVSINHELVDKIREKTHLVEKSDRSHDNEHSIEVQLPFLQYIFEEDFTFIPLTMTYQKYGDSVELGRILGDLAKEENIVVIASSDLTHYQSYEEAKKQDLQVIEQVEKMNIQEMYNLKQRKNISMCGIGPIAVTMQAALSTGRNTANKLKYASSGDTAGDRYRVVGYASVKFS